MPRSYLIRSDLHPYHIVSRCNNKQFFPLPLKDVWREVMTCLHKCHKEHGLAIHGFVLMGNHFHLICHTPRSNIDQAMHSLLINTANALSKKPLWEGRYKWTLIDSQTHYYQVYRYIFQNPIRAGLVEKVQDYPYSTITTNPPFPLHSFVPMSFGGAEGELIWLNERYNTEEASLIKIGLKKYQFSVNRRKLKAFNKLSVPKET